MGFLLIEKNKEFNQEMDIVYGQTCHRKEIWGQLWKKD